MGALLVKGRDDGSQVEAIWINVVPLLASGVRQGTPGHTGGLELRNIVCVVGFLNASNRLTTATFWMEEYIGDDTRFAMVIRQCDEQGAAILHAHRRTHELGRGGRGMALEVGADGLPILGEQLVGRRCRQRRVVVPLGTGEDDQLRAVREADERALDCNG